MAYGPPPGSRAARIDAVAASAVPAAQAPSVQPARTVAASVEFEPPAPGVSSSIRAVALDGATGAPFMAVQEAPVPGAGSGSGAGAGSSTSYLAPLHPATLAEMRRVPLSYASHNGTAAPGDVPTAAGIDALRRLVLAAVSDAPANASFPYRSRGAVLSADADALLAHPMYPAGNPDPTTGYYHPYHAWQPTAMAVNGTPPGANASTPTAAYVAGAALDATAAQSGLAYPSSYGIHTVLLGNSSGFSPNYTSVHSLILAGPHAAARPDAASFAIASLALDADGGALYALYANGTLAAHALAPGAGSAAGYAVPAPASAPLSHGLAGAGPGLSLDAGRGLLYAAPAGLSSVLVYDLRAAGGPALAAEVPVPPPVSALAASASDGTVHVLGGMPGGPGAPIGAAAYVVGPGAAPLALAAPPSMDLRLGTLSLALDRRAVASSIDPSGIVLRGSGGSGASEPVRLSGAAVLSSGYTAAPEMLLTEAQRRAAAAIHAWDGPLLASVSGGAVRGVVGAPLAAVASAVVRVTAAPANASLVLAAAVSPYEVRAEYDAPVNATASLYGGLSLEPGGRRAVEAVRGAGTAVHILEIDRAGGPMPPDAAGTLEVRRLPDLGSRSTFDGAAAAPVSDAQRPSVASAVVIDNASVAVFFDEPVSGVEPADFGPLAVGAQERPPVFEIARVSGSGSYRLLHVADGSPPVPRNAHGSLGVGAASFEDMAGNPGGGGAGGTAYVTPGRATATTDGRAPVPATPGMYARAIVASTSLGASLDLSPLGGRPLPSGGGPITLDAFDAAVILPPGASVVSGMPPDGVVRVSGSAAEAGPRASIGGGRILAMADTGGAGGAPVRLDAPAAIVVPGAAGETIAFLQEPGGAPEAVLGSCGDIASQAARPAELRAAAEAHLNGSGSCAADLAGDKIVVTFVLATVGVAARSEPGVPSASDAAVCGDSGADSGAGNGRISGSGADASDSPAGLAGCAPPHVAVIDTGGLAATAVAAAPAAPAAAAGHLATVFVAASDPGPFGNGNGSSNGGPSILVYSATAGGGVSPVAASSLGAGRSVLALEAAVGGGSNGSAPAAAYAVVAGPPPSAAAEGGSRAEPPAVLARINAGGEAEPGAAELEYIDARGRVARVGASDRIPALHVDAAAGRAYVAVLANASARGGLGVDGPILAVDTAADPGRLLRQHAGPYDPRNASAGAYYYPAEAWRPTALAVWHGQPPAAYAVGARLSAAAAPGGGGGAGQGAPADPLSGAESHGIQAVSFAGAGDPPAFTPNYTLRAELEIARYPGGEGGDGAGPTAAVPGLPAAGAALDGAGEKLYVLYGNGTLSVYAAGAAGDGPTPAGPPRPLYVLDEIDGPSALASSAEGILYAAGSGELRAYDMRADMLIGSLGMPGIADIDASSPGTVYAVGRGGAVLAVGGAAAAPPALRPSPLESLVAATPDGGTALAAPGRYDNVSLVLDRPVKLAADPPGSAVLGPSSRIVVLVPPSGTVTVEGLAFNGTRCPSGADPSAPESAAIRVSDGAWAAARQQQQQPAGGSAAILSNSFAGTCGAAVSSNATAAAGLAIRSNAIESAGAGRQGAAIAVSGLAGAASVESNRVLGAAGLAVSVHNVSGAVVSGNHVEDAAGGGVSVSSSSAVRVTGNTFAGLAGPAVVARDMRPADAAANATGIFSDGLAATLNAVYGTDVALSVLEPAGPRGEAAAPTGSDRPTVRFNFNKLHAHEGTAPAISNNAPGARVDARSNYYPGLGPGSYPRLAGSAQEHVMAEPAAALPGGPLRIGVLLDAASHPHIDGPAAEAARAAADEANRRAAGIASAPPVELVEAGGAAVGVGANGSAGAGAATAAAARAIASGAASDERMKPVLLRSIGEAASWRAESPDGALARIAAAPNRGHAVFAADPSGAVLAASASGAASPAPGLPHPAAAADPAAFAAAVGRLSAAGGGISGGATAWLGHALPDGSMVRTLLAYSGGIVLGASYEAGPLPRAYVGPASAAGLAAASAALPAGTPIVSHAVVDGRAVAEAGPSVFSMAPAAADSSAPLAGQVMAEDRAAAVIPVVQADDYSLRFAAAALAEYVERAGGGGTVLHSVSFAPAEESTEFWSSAAAGMEAAAAGLAGRGGLAPHEVAVLYVGGGGPFEALAYHALSRPALAGAQWHVGDAIAQASQPGAAGPPAAPWHAPDPAAPNSTSAEELSRRAPIVALSFEPARGLGIEPAAAALAGSVLAEIRLRQAASAQAVQAAHGPAAAGGGTMTDAYAHLAYDAVLVLAGALPAAEAANPDAPEYGEAIRQAAARGAQPGGGARIGIVGGAAFDAGGSLAHPAPYEVWASAPSGPPARAGTFASPQPLCGIALAEDRLDLGGARPGGASAHASQAISNAGTAPLEEVAVDATDWAAPAGSGGRSGAPPTSLPFSLTEVAAGRPPPGAPPPVLPPGEFAPIARDGAVLVGLAPGNAMQLHFVLNLTSVAEAAPSPVEQTVSYTAACR